MIAASFQAGSLVGVVFLIDEAIDVWEDWGGSTRLARTPRELQQQALAELSAEAAKHDFIKEFYIFGSVARGEEHPDDIDIAFQYDEAVVAQSGPFDTSVEGWEAALEEWKSSLARKLSLPISLHDLRDLTDLARKHILENRNDPLDSMGRAKLVYTPPKGSV
jgi:predicted nucleotidyltransferase